jgi:hypothetical protein
MPRKQQKGPKHLATAPRQALAEAKGAAGTAPAAATGTAAAGIAAPLALATLACAVAALVGSGILLQQQGSAEQPGAAWSATRRAELEGLKLPELVALVGESSVLSEDELDDAMEADSPKLALIAALLEQRGLSALRGALGLAGTSRQPAAGCGTLLLLSGDRGACRSARCQKVGASYAQVRDAAGASPRLDLLRFVTVSAQIEPAFAAMITQIGARSDLGWANASLPLLYFTKTRTDLRDPAQYDTEEDRLLSALITGEEVPDAYSGSPFTLSAYLRQACGQEILSGDGLESVGVTRQHKLAAAAQAGDATLLRELLSQTTPKPATASDGSGECGHRTWRGLCWEPLHAAFRWWTPEQGVPGQVVTALLEAGLSVNVTGASGHTVLHRLLFEWGLAVFRNDNDPTPLMMWLLDQRDCDLMQADTNQQTVLHMAGASFSLLATPVPIINASLINSITCSIHCCGMSCLHAISNTVANTCSALPPLPDHEEAAEQSQGEI